MPSSTMLRSRYVTDSVQTMSPSRLLVALYDRLVLDLERAEAAIEARDPSGAHQAFMHAQDIVTELFATLDTASWGPGAGLAALYEYMLEELVAANVTKDAERCAVCRSLVEPLRDAWREAAGVVGPALPTVGAA